MKLLERAQQILRNNACLTQEETLLIVTDDLTLPVGTLFYEAAQTLTRNVSLMRMPPLQVAGQEPPQEVAAAMSKVDVVLCPTSQSITHTNARIKAAAEGTRVITLPGITLDMLQKGAACADYRLVEKRTYDLTERLTQAHTARIEKEGHTLTLSLEKRKGVASSGVYRKAGESGNFPSGEAYIAPCEGKGTGSLCIDGSMVGIGKLTSPLYATIEEGRLRHLEGDDAAALAILFERPENGIVAELGIGTNSDAILSGNILEDEKLYGTVHVAFGTNTSFGGTNKADCHYDGIILNPTLYLDDELIIDKGIFVNE